MKIDIHNIDKHALDIIKTLQDNGFEAFLVGGAVRDLILGFTPKDFDIATSAKPQEIKRIFRYNAQIIGRRFKLVHIIYYNDIYEVSTFRRKPSEIERKGRTNDSGVMIWRDNEYGTLQEDAFRRDFSVNALYFDPVKNKISDLVGGLNDLEKSIVKSIGNSRERILEDPVRMIRAIKLQSQYKFSIEEKLRKVIIREAKTIELASPARLFEEVLKILDKPYSEETFEKLSELGILEHLLPTINLAMTSGKTTKEMLAVRDANKISKKNVSNSRVLALSTLCFHYVQKILQQFSGEEKKSGLWKFKPGINELINHTINDCFYKVSLPDNVRKRIGDLFKTLTFFPDQEKAGAILSSSEYRYAREIFFNWLNVIGKKTDQFLKNYPEKISKKSEKNDFTESQDKAKKQQHRRPKKMFGKKTKNDNKNLQD